MGPAREGAGPSAGHPSSPGLPGSLGAAAARGASLGPARWAFTQRGRDGGGRLAWGPSGVRVCGGQEPPSDPWKGAPTGEAPRTSAPQVACGLRGSGSPLRPGREDGVLRSLWETRAGLARVSSRPGAGAGLCPHPQQGLSRLGMEQMAQRGSAVPSVPCSPAARSPSGWRDGGGVTQPARALGVPGRVPQRQPEDTGRWSVSSGPGPPQVPAPASPSCSGPQGPPERGALRWHLAGSRPSSSPSRRGKRRAWGRLSHVGRGAVPEHAQGAVTGW